MNTIHGPSGSVSLRVVLISAILALALLLVVAAGRPHASPIQPQSSQSSLPSAATVTTRTAVSTSAIGTAVAGPAILDDLSDRLAASPPSLGGPPSPRSIDAVTPDLYDSSHYWAGVEYTGTSTTATQVGVTLAVPDDIPQGGNDEPGNPGGVWYVALLSVWDNTNSYDQLGFVSMFGEWTVVYSTTDGCPGTYNSEYPMYELTRGQTYVFNMSLSSGDVDFSATVAGASTPVWSTSWYTGASEFEIDGFQSACSGDPYGYTDYEEVMDTMGPFVPYDFFFANNWVNSFGDVGTWGIMSPASPAPSGVNVYINGGGSSNSCGGSVPGYCPIVVANEPYYVYFTNGHDSMTVEPSLSTESHYWNVTVADVSSDSPIYLAPLQIPSGWMVNILGQGNPTFTAEITFSLPSTTSAGSYTIEINATDGSGSGSYNRIALSVHVLPILSASVQSSPGSGGIDVGQTVIFSANAGGGSGSYAYDWTEVPLGCGTTTSSSFQCVPSVAGDSSLTVTVVDSLGYTTTVTSTYIVDTDPAVAAPSASPGTVDVGQETVFSAVASGGSGFYTYAWVGLPVGCSSSGGATVSCSPSGSGSFSVVAVVTDSNDFARTSPELSFEVYSLPSVSLSVTPSSVLESGSVTFTAVVSGGAGGLAYSWNGLPSGCTAPTGPTLTCSPSATGTFNVTVSVVDRNGGASSSSADLTVNWSLFGLSALEWFGIVALLILTGVVLGIVLLVTRRKRRDDLENPSVAERVQQYSPKTRVSPVDNITLAPSEVWPDSSGGGVPLDAMGGGDSSSAVVDTGNDPVHWHTPLLNPPETLCWHCQSQNPPASLYCSRCGLPLEPPPPGSNDAGRGVGAQA